MINKDARQDYVEPVEVAKGVYWIGFYDAQAAFHCNPYLIVDGDEAVVIDPGSVLDYPKVASKIFSIVSPRQVKHIILHHQDPDLCASVPFLEDHIGTPGPQLVTHSRASVLIRYYGVKNSFYLVDKHDYTLTLSSGRILRFIVTPFCHFPAAIMTYDASSKILFSSDVFGGISKDWTLYAQPGYENTMSEFHRGYMASSAHLRAVIERLEAFEIDMILPQHGSVIRREMVSPCMKYLKELKCGSDLAYDDDLFYGWIPADRNSM